MQLCAGAGGGRLRCAAGGDGGHISGRVPTIEVEGVEVCTGASHRVIPDRIEAGTYLIAGALCGDRVTVDRCRPEHLGALLEVLEAAGELQRRCG